MLRHDTLTVLHHEEYRLGTATKTAPQSQFLRLTIDPISMILMISTLEIAASHPTVPRLDLLFRATQEAGIPILAASQPAPTQPNTTPLPQWALNPSFLTRVLSCLRRALTRIELRAVQSPSFTGR